MPLLTRLALIPLLPTSTNFRPTHIVHHAASPTGFFFFLLSLSSLSFFHSLFIPGGQNPQESCEPPAANASAARGFFCSRIISSFLPHVDRHVDVSIDVSICLCAHTPCVDRCDLSACSYHSLPPPCPPPLPPPPPPPLFFTLLGTRIPRPSQEGRNVRKEGTQGRKGRGVRKERV
jgi:hypothetical protein